MAEKEYSFGFIGCGNMGGTLAAAVAASGTGSLALADHSAEKAESAAKRLGADVLSNKEIFARCKMIFLGVKPQVLPSVLENVSQHISGGRHVLVSMAAGIAIESIEAYVGESTPIIRIMPNTPAAVGAGTVLYCKNDAATDDDVATFTAAMAPAGSLCPLPEELIDAGCALTGCGPAFVYMFIEALADGGVRCGLPRDLAADFAAQVVYGSAKTAMESECHTAQLKDAVCSPGGSTIAGVEALEHAAFRAAAMDAVTAAFERTKELGK